METGGRGAEAAMEDSPRGCAEKGAREMPGINIAPEPAYVNVEAPDKQEAQRDHPGLSAPPRLDDFVRRRYFVRITISAYGLVGATPPESAVTFAKPAAGTPTRAYAGPPPRE